MSIIRIKNLKLNAIIGTKEEEKLNKQVVLANISIEYNATEAIADDNLTKAIDYEAIASEVIVFVEKSNCQLLEKLCDEVANLIMLNPLIQKTTVELDKLSALDTADSVSIQISKERQ